MKFLIFITVISLFPARSFSHSCNSVFKQKKERMPFSRSYETVKFYKAIDQIEDFWRIHTKFGFVKVEGKIVLGAINIRVANKIIKELITSSGVKSYDKSKFKIKGFSRKGEFFDVSSLFSKDLVSYVESPLYVNKLNCFGACLYGSYFLGFRPLAGRTLSDLFKTPLFKEVSFSERRAGDIIYIYSIDHFAANDPGVHAAVFVSPTVVFTKNGEGSASLYRFLDVNEMTSVYMAGEYSERVKIQRPAGYKKFFNKYPQKNQKQIREDLEILSIFESQITKYRSEVLNFSNSQLKKFAKKIFEEANRINSKYYDEYSVLLLDYQRNFGKGKGMSKVKMARFGILSLLVSRAENYIYEKLESNKKLEERIERVRKREEGYKKRGYR